MATTSRYLVYNHNDRAPLHKDNLPAPGCRDAVLNASNIPKPALRWKLYQRKLQTPIQMQQVYVPSHALTLSEAQVTNSGANSSEKLDIFNSMPILQLSLIGS